MSSTFTTPLRINKRNNPTNNGVIAPSNTGAALCTQQQFFAPISAPIPAGALPTFKFGETTPSAFVLPAGSIIQTVQFYFTSAPSSISGGTITVNMSVTDPVTGVVTTTAIGTRVIVTSQTTGFLNVVQSPTVTGLLTNVGPLDVVISFETAAITGITGTLAGTIQVGYTARNADGSITAYGENLTNN